jgi:hypothetical protein
MIKDKTDEYGFKKKTLEQGLCRVLPIFKPTKTPKAGTAQIYKITPIENHLHHLLSSLYIANNLTLHAPCLLSPLFLPHGSGPPQPAPMTDARPLLPLALAASAWSALAVAAAVVVAAGLMPRRWWRRWWLERKSKVGRPPVLAVVVDVVGPVLQVLPPPDENSQR